MGDVGEVAAAVALEHTQYSSKDFAGFKIWMFADVYENSESSVSHIIQEDVYSSVALDSWISHKCVYI
jgi:hypothetical protein